MKSKEKCLGKFNKLGKLNTPPTLKLKRFENLIIYLKYLKSVNTVNFLKIKNKIKHSIKNKKHDN